MDEQAHSTVLVTGGTGFIGVPLVSRLQSAGYQVAVLTRDPERARRRLGPAVRLIREPLEASELQPQAIVNLAGEGIADRPWTQARRKALLDSRIALTEALATALADSPPAVVVSASAVGFYGTSETASLTEADGPGTGFAADLCERWEAAALRFERLGARVTRLRIGLVLGPGGLLGRLKLPFSLGLGGRIGSGRQWMSWVHRDDVLGLIEFALAHAQAAGALNATAPEPATNREFTRALGRALNRPAVLPVPAFLLRAALGDMAEELLLEGAKVLPARAQELGYQFRHSELESAMANALQKPGD